MNVCALFKTLSAGGNYFNFSQYTEDLISSINNSDYNVTPSNFICLNLDVSNSTNISIPQYLQNGYENSCSVYRNNGGKDNIYLPKLIETIDKIGNNTLYYYGDINLFTSTNVDGTEYNEVYCYIPPTAGIQDISFTTNASLVNYEYDKLIISGYTESYTDEDGNYIEGNYNGDPDIGNSPIPMYSYSILESVDYTEQDTTTSYKFNTIIVLYKVTNSEGEIIFDNIPMGIYFTGQITSNEMEDEVTKYISNGDIYNQGTSYGIRISNRLLSTVNNGDIQTEFYMEDGSDNAMYADALDKLGQLTSTIYDHVDDTKSVLNDLKTNLIFSQSYKTNVPYIVEVVSVDGVVKNMWYVNGASTEIEATGESGESIDIYYTIDDEITYKNGSLFIDEEKGGLYVYKDGWVSISGTEGKQGEPGSTLSISENVYELTDSSYWDDESYSIPNILNNLTYSDYFEDEYGDGEFATNDSIFVTDSISTTKLYVFDGDTFNVIANCNFMGNIGETGSQGYNTIIYKYTSTTPSTTTVYSADEMDEDGNYYHPGYSLVYNNSDSSKILYTMQLDWKFKNIGNISGPQGEDGDQGDPGEQGPRGDNFDMIFPDVNSEGVYSKPETPGTTTVAMYIDDDSYVWKWNPAVGTEGGSWGNSAYANIRGSIGMPGNIRLNLYRSFNPNNYKDVLDNPDFLPSSFKGDYYILINDATSSTLGSYDIIDNISDIYSNYGDGSWSKTSPGEVTGYTLYTCNMNLVPESIQVHDKNGSLYSNEWTYKVNYKFDSSFGLYVDLYERVLDIEDEVQKITYDNNVTYIEDDVKVGGNFSIQGDFNIEKSLVVGDTTIDGSSNKITIGNITIDGDKGTITVGSTGNQTIISLGNITCSAFDTTDTNQ